MVPREPVDRSRPAAGEVRVWRAHLDGAAAARDALRALLSPDERARAERFRQQADRTRYELARGLLRRLLADRLGLDPRALRFETGPHGKPRLALGEDVRPVEFNVSHSGESLLVALADRPVGVDVERRDREVAVDLVAERFFAAPERALLQRLPAAERAELFLRIWVLKEALLKGLGVGIGALDLKSFAILPGTAAPARVEPLTGAAAAAVAGWAAVELAAGPGHLAALAVRGELLRLRVLDWPVTSSPASRP